MHVRKAAECMYASACSPHHAGDGPSRPIRRRPVHASHCSWFFDGSDGRPRAASLPYVLP